MDGVAESYQKAVRQLRTADHLLTQTYPFIQDPKLLLTVLENIFLALGSAMSAAIEREVMAKRIAAPMSTFDAKLDTVKLHLARPYGLRGEDLTMANEIKSILLAHRKSPMEFVRKDTFVICGEGYQLQTLSFAQLKQYYARAKVFIDGIGRVIHGC